MTDKREQVMVRLPRKLKRKIAVAAARNGTNLSYEINKVLAPAFNEPFDENERSRKTTLDPDTV